MKEYLVIAERVLTGKLLRKRVALTMQQYLMYAANVGNTDEKAGLRLVSIDEMKDTVKPSDFMKSGSVY